MRGAVAGLCVGLPAAAAGAFHTEHMAPAVGVLGSLARAVSTHDPRTPLISNRDGKVVHDGRDVVRRIVTQVASPVRWDLCMETMRDLGVTGLLEMPPAGTLAGIAKRALPGVETFALKTPDQLDQARAFVERHGTQSVLNMNPTWRLLVSPSKGTFVREAGREGEALAPESTIGRVCSTRDETAVYAPYGGTIVEWLVEDGDLVSPGQPLVRLHPHGVPA
jgi:[acyl-carrier-protein] S-malonyltransferase